MSWEILGVIIGAISLYLTYITFFKEHIESNKEKKEYLISRFEFAKKECERTLNNLKNYGLTNQYLDDLPVRDYLSMIEKFDRDLLTPQNLENIKVSRKWTLYHDHVLKSIDETIVAVHTINTEIRTLT